MVSRFHQFFWFYIKKKNLGKRYCFLFLFFCFIFKKKNLQKIYLFIKQNTFYDDSINMEVLSNMDKTKRNGFP